MKKLILVLTAVVFLFSAALAEDLSALTDEELQALYQNVEAEMARRELTAGQGTEFEAGEVRDRVTAFFSYWSVNNLDKMLEMCSSGWKASAAEPRTELFKILQNRTPVDLEIESAAPIAGESPDGFSYYYVTATSHLDRNNGTAYRKYRIHLLVRKEEDGLWYIDPTGLNDCEDAEAESPAEATAAPESEAGADAADMVLYYQPSGGEYYHLDQNCKRVNPTFLPLQGNFLYSELNDEPYRNLKRCEVCGAPFRQEDPPVSGLFRDAVYAAGEYAAVGGDADYLSLVTEKGGRYYRTVTLLDDRAKELYAALMEAEDMDAAYEAFDTYAWSLPVCYTEEIAGQPKDQAELDALTGKTVGELLEEEYSFYGLGGGDGYQTVVYLSSGLFVYEFAVDAPVDYYRDHEGWDGLNVLKVHSGKLTPWSNLATDLNWRADGTFRLQTELPVSAEESASAVPPIEEYSQKAWPVTAEGYADLQENIKARYGQVYMVEGAVLQVLSQSPLRAVICTGEDGKSQPVVVECPEDRSFQWEEGQTCKIYADVSSAFYTLPVLTARYVFYTSSEDTADEEDPVRFETFRDAVVSMEEGDSYTVSDGYAVAVVRRDGRCFRVVAQFDSHAEELYAAYLENGDFSDEEFRALSEYAKTLPVQYTEELNVTPFSQTELDAMTGVTLEQAMAGPWELKMCNYPEDAEAGKEIAFPMVKGFCNYELVINEPYEVYAERRAADHYDPVTVMSLQNYLDLTVKCVRYTGISALNALDLRYQADGTLKLDVEPFPDDYDYDLMVEIADHLAETWGYSEPDRETREAMIAELTEKHPEAAEMIRQIVESFR